MKRYGSELEYVGTHTELEIEIETTKRKKLGKEKLRYLLRRNNER